jgi:membrane protease YdiL (CAAX protease family)
MPRMSAGAHFAERGRIPDRALWPFLAMTFGLAWGIFGAFVLFGDRLAEIVGERSARHPLFILAVYSPAIAAVILVTFHSGVSGLKRYFSRLLLWRCPLGWYGLLLFGIPMIYLGGALVKGNLTTEPLPFPGVGPMLAAIAFMLVLGPVEELGWRGLALPLLQRRLAPFWSGLLLGIIWGVWHLPAFFLSGTPQSAWGFTPFLIGAVAVSIILTVLFNASRGSILLAALFHFQLNNPLWPDAQPYDTVLFVLAAALVTWFHRSQVFTRAGAVTEVVPRPSTPD